MPTYLTILTIVRCHGTHTAFLQTNQLCTYEYRIDSRSPQTPSSISPYLSFIHTTRSTNCIHTKYRAYDTIRYPTIPYYLCTRVCLLLSSHSHSSRLEKQRNEMEYDDTQTDKTARESPVIRIHISVGISDSSVDHGTNHSRHLNFHILSCNMVTRIDRFLLRLRRSSERSDQYRFHTMFHLQIVYISIIS